MKGKSIGVKSAFPLSIPEVWTNIWTNLDLEV